MYKKAAVLYFVWPQNREFASMFKYFLKWTLLGRKLTSTLLQHDFAGVGVGQKKRQKSAQPGKKASGQSWCNLSNNMHAS